MDLQRLKCDTIGDLAAGDGRLIVDKAIEEAITDLIDRGHEDKKARTVTVALTFKEMDNGMIDARISAKAGLPPRKTPITLGEARTDKGKGGLVFSHHSPGDPRQRTIEDVQDEKARKA